MVNLYPYNMYIFYASIVLLIIFIGIALSHALKALKAVKELENGLGVIKASTDTMNRKVKIVKKKIDGVKRVITPIIISLPVLLAIKKIYDASGEHGFKGYRKAASSYYSTKIANETIAKEVEKAMHI